MKEKLFKIGAVACGLVFIANYVSGLQTALVYSGTTKAAMGISILLGAFFIAQVEGKEMDIDG